MVRHLWSKLIHHCANCIGLAIGISSVATECEKEKKIWNFLELMNSSLVSLEHDVLMVPLVDCSMDYFSGASVVAAHPLMNFEESQFRFVGAQAVKKRSISVFKINFWRSLPLWRTKFIDLYSILLAII